jgi:hypothetical protein
MTTVAGNTTPLVNCIQQALYPGESGAPTQEGTDATTTDKPKSSGWWALQYNPSNPTQLTMLVTLTAEQTDAASPVFYSSQLSADEAQSLYQWLALQMSQQKTDSG